MPTAGLPAITQFGSSTVLAHTLYQQGYVHFHVADNGLNFDLAGQYFSNVTSDTTPAITALSDRVVFAWTGTDSQINLGYSKDLQQFAFYAPTGETTGAGPALTTLNNQVYIAWTGTDSASSINIGRVDEGLWDFTITLPESAVGQVSLGTSGDQLVLVWTGTDGRINLMQSGDGRNWSGKQIFNETATGAPGAIGVAGGILLGWAGNDSNNSLNTAMAQLGGSGELANKVIYDGDSSYAGAAFFEFQGSAYLLWTGTDIDRQVNYMPLAV